VRKTIAYHTHQGFGDLIVCSPIANYLAEINPDKRIILITRSESYARNLRRFCVPQVDVAYIPEYPLHSETLPQNEIILVNAWVSHHGFSLVRSGFDGYYYDSSKPWDYSFYENAGVDYSVKSTHFHISRDSKRESEIFDNLRISKGEKYAFVHDDAKRGFAVEPNTDLRIIRNPEEYDIADSACLLENATELHMMGSSLMCLTDVLGLPYGHQKGYYYTFRGDLNARGIEKWQKVS